MYNTITGKELKTIVQKYDDLSVISVNIIDNGLIIEAVQCACDIDITETLKTNHDLVRDLHDVYSTHGGCDGDVFNDEIQNVVDKHNINY